MSGQMKNQERTVRFITLGCKTNQYETDGMAQRMQAAGYRVVTEDVGTDITVVNTCAVTNIAERKSRQMMRRAKKLNPDTILIAAGCYIQNVEATLDQLEEVDIFLGNNQKQYIVDYVASYEENLQPVAHVIDINHTSEYEEFSISGTKEHTRAYIKVQDGCNQFCSYCIIPYVRGRVRSRAQSEIVCEAQKLAEDGFKEIVLTGIHISSYGVDFEDGTDMLSLLYALHAIDGIERIRLGSLEPRIITPEFVQAICQLPKICPHFHLSLQSGCDDTLKRMNRKYTVAEYQQACQLLRQHYDHPAITTDVIVGFPGETEAEFEATYAYLEQLKLYETHVFKYSVRKGTNAEKLPDHVDGNVKNERSDRLLLLHEKNKSAFEAAMIGCSYKVLIEEEKQLDDGVYFVGHTMNYVKVAIAKTTDDFCLSEKLKETVEREKNDINLVGSIVEVRIDNRRVSEYMVAHFG